MIPHGSWREERSVINRGFRQWLYSNSGFVFCFNRIRYRKLGVILQRHGMARWTKGPVLWTFLWQNHCDRMSSKLVQRNSSLQYQWNLHGGGFYGCEQRPCPPVPHRQFHCLRNRTGAWRTVLSLSDTPGKVFADHQKTLGVWWICRKSSSSQSLQVINKEYLTVDKLFLTDSIRIFLWYYFLFHFW